LSDILVDTNILVYTFDPRDIQKQNRSREVIERLLASDRAVVSVQCLTEFFRTVHWRLPEPLSPNAALAEVTRLSLACHVLDLTLPAVLEACRASNEYQMSIWDALIWSVAKLNQIPYVLTEDAARSVLETVRFLNRLSRLRHVPPGSR
jgi:predicted nucleic acid-binding protein